MINLIRLKGGVLKHAPNGQNAVFYCSNKNNDHGDGGSSNSSGHGDGDDEIEIVSHQSKI